MKNTFLNMVVIEEHPRTKIRALCLCEQVFFYSYFPRQVYRFGCEHVHRQLILEIGHEGRDRHGNGVDDVPVCQTLSKLREFFKAGEL